MIPSGAETIVSSVFAPTGPILRFAFCAVLESNDALLARTADPLSRFGGVWLPMPQPRHAAICSVSVVPKSVAVEVPVEALTAEEQLEAIQDALSLSVSRIADILNVTRPTIYAWTRGEVIQPRDPADANRLRRLYQVARRWQELSDVEAGSFVSLALGDGKPSLLSLLAASKWDDAAIDNALNSLADHLRERAALRDAQRRGLAEAPISAEQIAIEREQLRSITRRARRRRPR
jgi:DNA-binding transcriptional regulator YiaG